jgi:hypothetical protein
MNQIFIPHPSPGERGFMSGLRGEDPRVCPFEKMSAEWNEWQRWHGHGVELYRLLDEDRQASEPLPDQMFCAGWVALLVLTVASVGLLLAAL